MTTSFIPPVANSSFNPERADRCDLQMTGVDIEVFHETSVSGPAGCFYAVRINLVLGGEAAGSTSAT